jgi:chromosome partitioning protein
MPVIVVANPKGGVGKTTLSTNIAGYLAARGHLVMLGDVDRQQSARAWLDQRPKDLPTIANWEVARDHIVRPPKGTTHLVLDTPAGLHGDRLNAVMKLATHVLVPLQPSIFDIRATHDFIQQLLAHKRGAKFLLATVGMRTREGTIATDHLRAYLGHADMPMLGFLRDTQNYVHLAAHGRTLWDVAPGRFERDLEQWSPITTWLDSDAPTKDPKEPVE